MRSESEMLIQGNTQQLYCFLWEGKRKGAEEKKNGMRRGKGRG